MGSGPVLVSQGTYLTRAAAPRHSGTRLVRPFSMAHRNYESSEGVPGPDAGVLTAAVHDEVSRSRFLDEASLVALRSRGTGPRLPVSRGERRCDGEKKREDAALSS